MKIKLSDLDLIMLPAKKITFLMTVGFNHDLKKYKLIENETPS